MSSTALSNPSPSPRPTPAGGTHGHGGSLHANPTTLPSATPSLSRTLTSGASDLLSACEDCVSEIRFHQDALVRALERKGSMSARLQNLLQEVGRTCTPPSPCAPAADSGIGAVRRAEPIWPSDPPGKTPGPEPTQACEAGHLRLSVFCFGHSQVFQGDTPVEAWTHSKGKAIFKYLVLHHRQAVAKDVLMREFWPDADADSARNNLNVSIYGLRKALARLQPGCLHVLLEDGRYRLNPALELWVDVDRFVEAVQLGREHEMAERAEAAISAYRQAEQIYRGDLFVEDRTEDWIAPERTRLREMALDTLRRMSRLGESRGDLETSLSACRRVTDIDPCDEDAHRQLMRLYNRSGQPHLALRQFQTCAENLSRELHMIPSPATTALYRQIQRRDPC